MANPLTARLAAAQAFHLHTARRLRFFPAVGAGLGAGIVFLVLYYGTLWLLPPAFAYPTTDFPALPFARRFDLSQLFGALLHPPLPSPLTWIIGVIVLLGTLIAFGVIYAFLLSWGEQCSDVARGIGFGVALFLGLGVLAWLAPGFHPATMRNAFPDVGFFLLGWTPWATLQLLIVNVIYGAVLGFLYGRAQQ